VKMNKRYIQLALTFCLINIGAFAQSTLSLDSAKQIALANNYQIAIGEIREGVAERNNTILNAGFTPTITSGANFQSQKTDQNNPASFINGTYSSENLSGNVNLTWPIFNGLQAWTNKEQLARQQELAQGNLQLIINNTLTALNIAYYNVALQQAVIKAQQSNLVLSRNKLERQKIKQEIGTEGKFELIQFESNYLNDSIALLQSRKNYLEALKTFNQILAAPDQSTWNFPEIEHLNKVTYTLDALKDRLINNSQLKIAYTNIKLQQGSETLARKNFLPQINFNAGYSDASGKFSFMGNTNNSTSANYFIGFSLNYTIFGGLQKHRTLQNAIDNVYEAQINFEEQKNTVFNELRALISKYQQQFSIVDLRAQQLKLSAINLSLASEKFDRGLLNSFDFRNIQSENINQNTAYLNAVFELKSLEATIESLSR